LKKKSIFVLTKALKLMKNKSLVFSTTLLLLISLANLSFNSDSRRISVTMESKRLHKGKVVTVKADIFFKYTEGILIMHYSYPNDYVFMTNTKGEVKVYYPDKNEVMVQQNQMFSSDNDALYFFLSNKLNDLGLKESGYKLQSTKFENGLTVSSWLPPAMLLNKISRVQLAHENYLPIYSAYYNAANRPLRKVYFSNYYVANQAAIPQRITEIEYLPNGDSVISRKIYSNINFDGQARSSYFDFKIPANAKLLTLRKK
jgi:hypothetical protein